MATAQNSTNSRRRKNQALPEFKSKSARFVALLKSGKSISEVQKITGDGYAFIYGVAKRNGLAATAANRRATRVITVDKESETVVIQTKTGAVTVHMDGQVVTPLLIVGADGKVSKIRKNRSTK